MPFNELIGSILSKLAPFYIQLPLAVTRFYASYSRTILDYLHSIFKGLFNILLLVTICVSLGYVALAVIERFTKKKQMSMPLNRKNQPFVTIQIPTYNELAALNCARRCLAFDYPLSKYEIIIGDDSSDAAISAKIDEFASLHNIRVTRRGSNAGFKPGNLNHMLKFSKGEILVIFDSDFLPEKDFLKRIVQPFGSDSQLSVVQARWKIANHNQNMITVLGGSISQLIHAFVLPVLARRSDVSFLCGSAEAVRKKHLIELGGWKEGSLTEDVEFSLRLLKAGYKLTYLEDLECACETPFTIKDYGKQQMRWSYGVISAFKEHLGSYFFTSKTNKSAKLLGILLLSGYTFTFLIMLLFFFGMASFITDRPAPIDWAKLLGETAINVAWTSGLVLVSAAALAVSGKAKYVSKLVFATFSIGIVAMVYVNLGILKALCGRSMHWFMISKNGNLEYGDN